ncbi:MAG: beta-N-acetylhexosaminidase [Sorangiineae bacterium]|nr:beta-N-acetylhexosaminidase [Polyangiaceae bacterium]MEB2324683.1 beta-N-acetylhexosaminidase [Sorangiineae bacterium]
MNEALELEQLCGQLLVVGFPGTELPTELEDALRRGVRGGVILFKRNLPSLEVAHQLCSAATRAAPAELPLFVGVDEEGGRVRRLPSPALALPPMRQLGERGDRALVARAGELIGRGLRALGFNLDFAPVLDVDNNPKNPIIGDRAFSRDPEEVARLAPAFVEGLRRQGVLGCGKHFPGHGDTAADSHLELPAVTRDEASLRAVELPPFRAAIEAGVAALMSAHVVYPALEPELPATLSHRICTELLRDELGFRGVLFSDDLEMKALAGLGPGEAAVRAIRAGCDALLVCSDAALAEAAHAALVSEAALDPAFRARCEEALRRCLAARRSAPPRPVAEVALLAEAFPLAEHQAFLDALGERP